MNETCERSWFDHVKGESQGGNFVSEAAGQDLYSEHEVKPDLVLGPELLQPQDVVYSIRQYGPPIKVEKDAVNGRRVSEPPQFIDEQPLEPLDAPFMQQVQQNSVKQELEPKTSSGKEQILYAGCLELLENAVNPIQYSERQPSDRKPLNARSLGQVDNNVVKQEDFQVQSNLDQSINAYYIKRIKENSKKAEQDSYSDPVHTSLEQEKNAVKVEQDSRAQYVYEQSFVCAQRVEQNYVRKEEDIHSIVDAGFINQVDKDTVKDEINRFDERVIKQLLMPCVVKVDRLPDMKFNPCLIPEKDFLQKPLIIHINAHNEGNMSPESKNYADLSKDIKEYSLEISGEPIETETDITATVSDEKRTSDAVKVIKNVNVTRKKKHNCDTCGEKFTSKKKLKTHHSRKHREKIPKTERRKKVIEKKYKCNLCGRWFDVKVKLIAHIQIHMGLKPYACEVCGAQYTSFARLELHERAHTGVKPFICDICDKRFGCKYGISIHMIRHMRVTFYNCKICNKGFLFKQSLVQHELVHTGLKSHTCEICHKQFVRRSSLNVHILTHTMRKIICEICGKIMTSLKSLPKHKLIHADVKPYPCQFCKKKYRTSYAMRQHTMRVHTKGNSSGPVDPVNLLDSADLSVDIVEKQMHIKEISNISQNKENRSEYSNEVEIPNIMPLVESSASNKKEQVSLQNFQTIYALEAREIVGNVPPCYSNETQLPLETSSAPITESVIDLSESGSQVQIEFVTVQSEHKAIDAPEVTKNSEEPIKESRHETNNHDAMEVTVKTEVSIKMLEDEAKKKPYSCNTCGKRYSEKNQLIPHFRVHTGEICCEFCGKTFAYPCYLMKHKQTHMEKPMHYSCDFCEMKFKAKRSLEAHSRVHTGKKLHPCKLCTKQFATGHKLTVHMRTHTGEKPYFCNICDKRFGQRSNLARHQRTHAPQNKPYSCDICHKRFVTRAYAAIHKKIHTGEKPYTCEICSRQFLHSDSYNNHKKLHVGPKEKKHACKICNAKFANSCHLTRHHQIHTGVKPFSCDLCDKRFYSRTHLKRHSQNQKRPCVD